MRELPPPSDPNPSPLPGEWPLSAFHYVQLMVTLETIVLLPVLVQYLRLVLRFNAARCPPDVADEDAELPSRALSRSHRPSKDDAAYVRRLLRRQADCIQALRAHNTMLGRKIVDQHERLTSARLRAEGSGQSPQA
ncbi:uncharacterized protein LOC119107018 [Pollicipes pollicipes]|nr:uncharacterized protein LOC119107011 [Pollicipes pollicipes]XP_037086264.1 uncharacterized protein LOC119107018 [Pollicipes pollicipes]